jgi:hypothetical protein
MSHPLSHSESTYRNMTTKKEPRKFFAPNLKIRFQCWQRQDQFPSQGLLHFTVFFLPFVATVSTSGEISSPKPPCFRLDLTTKSLDCNSTVTVTYSLLVCSECHLPATSVAAVSSSTSSSLQY